jgi:hypothetical protein
MLFPAMSEPGFIDLLLEGIRLLHAGEGIGRDRIRGQGNLALTQLVVMEI